MSETEHKQPRMEMFVVEMVRKAAGLSVREMCDRLNGLNPTTYRKWVRIPDGHVPKDLEHIVKKIMAAEGIETYDQAHALYEERKRK